MQRNGSSALSDDTFESFLVPDHQATKSDGNFELLCNRKLFISEALHFHSKSMQMLLESEPENSTREAPGTILKHFRCRSSTKAPTQHRMTLFRYRRLLPRQHSRLPPRPSHEQFHCLSQNAILFIRQSPQESYVIDSRAFLLLMRVKLCDERKTLLSHVAFQIVCRFGSSS